MVSQLRKQGKGAGKNSKTKEDKEAKLEGGEIKSQGQFMKEGRKDLLLAGRCLVLFMTGVSHPCLHAISLKNVLLFPHLSLSQY